ncbi:MAG TPA: DNA topoisomerase IV subunit B [Actinomycetes bacterium]|nr:DNA topoisomerase IV subunit B [Actinomycetes bacterium]
MSPTRTVSSSSRPAKGAAKAAAKGAAKGASTGAARGAAKGAAKKASPAKKASKSARGGYTAKHLSVLEGLEAVRKRPGVYIGSTDSRGLMHCLWEIIDNAVDEALAGHCHRIDVRLLRDGSVEVEDDGRGIPVDVEPKTKLTGVEVVMTKLHAGGKFGGGSYAASGGLHGVGASVVNALSARLDVEVDRDAKVHTMSFRRGIPGIFDGDGPDAAFSKKSGLRVVGKAPKRKTGTRVRFWPDAEIFVSGAEVSLDDLKTRMRQTSYLVPGLTLVLHDTRGGEVVEESYRHDGGISEYAEYLNPDEPVAESIRLHGVGHFHETVPVLDSKGHMTPQEVEREVIVDLALQWGNGYETTVRSFVNIIATPKGGTHVSGFERGLVRTINEQLRASKLLKTNDDAVVKDDVLEGLTAVVTVRLPEPQFEGQTKEVLGTSAVTRIVSNVVHRELTKVLSSSKRGDKTRSRAVLEKVLGAARARIAARQSKELQRRKNALETSSLPAKLADCRSGEIDKTELFIVEGDSALGTAKLARSSEIQALLPIRGKILNVQKASVADMLKNSECASIIQVLGAGSGRTFDVDAVRYGKVIVMTDADVDGAHIRTLLLTLFHRYMRPLLASGRVYAAVPPLHRIEVITGGSKPNEVRYAYSDAEMKSVLADLEKKGKRVKQPVQRYKGLGEMDAEQLRETTMDPRRRTLRRITLEDAEHGSEVFELLMGNEVAPRRDFIVAGASDLDRARIDA